MESPREASDTISSLLSVEASAERLSARTSRVGLLTGYSGSASSGFLQLSSAPAGKEAPRPTLESLYPTTPTEHSSGPRTWPGHGAAAAQRAGGLQRAAQSVDASSDNTERFVRKGAPTRRLHRRDSLKLDGLITDPQGTARRPRTPPWSGSGTCPRACRSRPSAPPLRSSEPSGECSCAASQARRRPGRY